MYGTGGRDGSRFGNLGVLYGVPLGGRTCEVCLLSSPLLSSLRHYPFPLPLRLEATSTNIHPYAPNSAWIRIRSSKQHHECTVIQHSHADRERHGRFVGFACEEYSQSSLPKRSDGGNAWLASYPRVRTDSLISEGLQRGVVSFTGFLYAHVAV
jgi:hypothetical protein